MAKTLKDFLEGYLKVKSADEQKFIDKHVTAKNPDRNGNGDDVFKGKTKTVDRRKERHGYAAGEDEKVYEELKGNQHKIDANKNGKVDAHDFKLLRGKKKVAEEAEQINEVNVNQIKKDLDSGMSHDAVIGKHANKGTTNTDAIRKVIKQHAWDKRMKKEEVEQIDELDTATLKSYRTKARAQGNAIIDKMKMGGGDWSKDQKDTKTLRKRAAGAQASGKQLVKRGESLKTEEVEQIDEDKRTPQEKVDHAIRDHRYDMMRTTSHADRAEKKEDHKAFLAAMKKKHPEVRIQEEVEDLDELSHDTLRRYRMKSKSIGDNEKGDINYRAKGRELAGRKTYGGRMAGIEKAKVMAKEEVQTEAFLPHSVHAELKSMPKDAIKRYYQTYMTTADNFKKHGAHALAAHGYGAAAEIKNKYMSEEAEQIDEISTEKLLAYRNKAKAGDIPVRRGIGIDTSDEKIKKKTGVYNPNLLQRAKAKLRNEEAEQIDEISYRDSGYSNMLKASRKADRIADEDRKRRETSEANYSAKDAAAGKDIGKPGKTFAKIANKAAAKYGSKAAGGRVAGAVLAKLRKEEKLAELIANLSESHQRTMTNVFEKLNEENKSKFIEACEAPDGVDQMLDFAINHRGE